MGPLSALVATCLAPLLLGTAPGCGARGGQTPTTSASAALTAPEGSDDAPAGDPGLPAEVAATPGAGEELAEAPPQEAPKTPPTPAALDAGDLRPLTADERARLFAGDDDLLQPTEIHYVKSNEIRHDVWFPYVRGLGGAYVGVGSDQNYTVLATARADLVFLMDIDRRVVDLHQIYGVLIAASEDAETLHSRWSPEGSETSITLLEEALASAEPAERQRILRAYRASRETVFIHLRHVLNRSRDGVATSWLADPALYDHVRRLWLAGRVRTLGGDFTGENALRTVGRVATDLEVPIRVLYMSNAEEYFRYVPSFIANIAALGRDPQAVVLRTIYSKDWVHADTLWAYQVQPLSDFQDRLGDTKNRSRNPMFRYAEREGSLQRTTAVTGLSLIAIPEADAPAEPPAAGG